MLKWNEVEKFLPQLKYQMDKQKMAYEIKMVSFIILFISMGKLFLKITNSLSLEFSFFQLSIFSLLRLEHMELTIAHRSGIQFERFTFQVSPKCLERILTAAL